jgi:transposase InsO family protein
MMELTSFPLLILISFSLRYPCIISRIAAFCGESLFLLAIIKTSKLSNIILHQFEGLHKLWDTPCTDFTYLFLANHEVRYNCAIIDLHDRSVIASITDRHITSDLAIRTLQKALDFQPKIKGKLILHSDQGSQFTSKAFVDFCESVHVTQSMSKAGYPYDNAPMERYFNTLKNEFVNLYEYHTEEALYQAVEKFAYAEYNYIRPHSFNNYATPHEARVAA